MTPSPFTHGEVWYYRPNAHRQRRMSMSIFLVDIPGEDPGVEDSGDRRIFLRKVLTTVSGQVLFNALLIALFVLKETAKAFLRENGYIFDAFNYMWNFTNFLRLFNSEFRPTNLAKYTIAILFTAFHSYLVAATCFIFKTSSIILAAGTTIGIFFFLMIICPPLKKIDVTKWWLFELMASVAVLIAGIIVWILYSKGSLTNEDYSYIIPSLILSVTLLLLLNEYFKVLGISWFGETETTGDTRLYLSLAINWELMSIFLNILFLIEPRISNPTCPLLIE